MSWSDGEETFPVEITAAVRFRMQAHVQVRGMTEGVPDEVIKRAAKRLEVLLNAAKEQVEAGILAELSKRVPGVQFGYDDTEPDGWKD